LSEIHVNTRKYCVVFLSIADIWLQNIRCLGTGCWRKIYGVWEQGVGGKYTVSGNRVLEENIRCLGTGCWRKIYGVWGQGVGGKYTVSGNRVLEENIWCLGQGIGENV